MSKKAKRLVALRNAENARINAELAAKQIAANQAAAAKAAADAQAKADRKAKLAEMLGKTALVPSTQQRLPIIDLTADGKPIVAYNANGQPITGIYLPQPTEISAEMLLQMPQGGVPGMDFGLPPAMQLAQGVPSPFTSFPPMQQPQFSAMQQPMMQQPMMQQPQFPAMQQPQVPLMPLAGSSNLAIDPQTGQQKPVLGMNAQGQPIIGYNMFGQPIIGMPMQQQGQAQSTLPAGMAIDPQTGQQKQIIGTTNQGQPIVGYDVYGQPVIGITQQGQQPFTPTQFPSFTLAPEGIPQESAGADLYAGGGQQQDSGSGYNPYDREAPAPVDEYFSDHACACQLAGDLGFLKSIKKIFKKKSLTKCECPTEG